MDWLDKAFTITNPEDLRNVALALIAMVGFPFLVWRTWLASKQTTISDKQVAITESNHVNDMFNKSIEQLGAMENNDPSIERRLGAIYSLEKIALNNPNYYQQVIDVLCSYVRLHAERPQNVEDQDQDRYKVREDIQVAITVIGRCLPMKPIITLVGRVCRHINKIRVKPDEESSYRSVNLSGAYLRQYSLYGGDFSHANLTSANLTNTNLISANLISADLTSANLTNTNLISANLISADLTSANLTNTNMISADLNSADLICANLTNAKLNRADLTYADLSGANLTNTNLTNTNLTNTNFIYADLSGANLTDANLSYADFTEADLNGVKGYKHESS
ncbi:pentapeptide repeat-containing protein [Algibacillus agarilyticus]|uniref:pentapeptide repeat-containing protein n=1 Tax=Algibacillus agarilyticus TaxID=2234133 RepID=UPI000DCFC809|nr:pentapeptide repeat-containing protein [Algibacillus agarilyticus]